MIAVPRAARVRAATDIAVPRQEDAGWCWFGVDFLSSRPGILHKNNDGPDAGDMYRINFA